jgi:bifunctional UDP-N-acetylglucosamine pyrophosphorylase/glucosamine-1-phosphate N-acetyltransferase
MGLMKTKIAAIILGAGKGTRMNADIPKVMMPVCGRPMIRHILDTLEELGADEIVTVISPDGDMVKKEVAPYKTAVQARQLGTGNAVLSAREALRGFDGIVLSIFGDNPTITREVFQKAVDRVKEGYAVVTLAVRPRYENRYGRLVTSGDELLRIVEYRDATEDERRIELCNSDLMAFDGRYIFEILAEIGNNNAAGEYYLTDAIAVARQKGLKCGYVENTDAIAGANTRADLALVEDFLKKRGAG